MFLSAPAPKASPAEAAAHLPAFVRDFHHQLGTDALLAPLFITARHPLTAAEYRFWQGVLSGTCYLGRPFPRLQVPAHLLAVYERWQLLLGATLYSHLPRTQAAEALAHASNVAVLLQHLALGCPTEPAPSSPPPHYPATRHWI
ncbi:globin family protein [Hymenobacter jeollabukensis]|uniref:Group III truncated hemoglobin n=1 Tax=Hymenobacter jeollabukensis TaxID=2025313 RepID=A0A5R8WMQ7_9BACT|nr:hypothetical protein [Hymenobacter jeollabukensis]TLM90995.1 hypothetical protein FDY95_15435 [Hymenobacter jeollabukensis]